MKHSIKIKKSVIIIGVPPDDSVRREIADFDLANKTPTDCFDFVRKLKRRCNDGGTKKR